jgi:hypothetical protein
MACRLMFRYLMTTFILLFGYFFRGGGRNGREQRAYGKKRKNKIELNVLHTVYNDFF